MDANIRRESTWEPLVRLVSSWLESWRNKLVSIGRRFTLLNLGLNAISIFFLSFMKMYVHFWKKLVGLQCYFPLGGSKCEVQVPWVKWEDVGKDKSLGDLEVKDLRLVNFIILIK